MAVVAIAATIAVGVGMLSFEKHQAKHKQVKHKLEAKQIQRQQAKREQQERLDILKTIPEEPIRSQGAPSAFLPDKNASQLVFFQVGPASSVVETLLSATTVTNSRTKVGLLDKETVLPPGNYVTAVGVCSSKDGVPLIKSCSRDLQYFLCGLTKDQTIIKLSSRTKSLLLSGIVVGSVSIGMMGYALIRNWMQWREHRDVLPPALPLASDETRDISDGQAPAVEDSDATGDISDGQAPALASGETREIPEGQAPALASAEIQAPDLASAETGDIPDVHAPAPASDNERGDIHCAICLTRRRQIAFVPCGHMICCRQCASSVEQVVQPMCPVCRQLIAYSLRIYDS